MLEPDPLGPAAVPLLDGFAPLVPDLEPLTLPAPEPPPDVDCAKEVVAKPAANAHVRAMVMRGFFI